MVEPREELLGRVPRKHVARVKVAGLGRGFFWPQLIQIPIEKGGEKNIRRIGM